MLFECCYSFFHCYILFRCSYHCDEMAMCHRSVYKYTRCIDLRHYSHQIHCLVIRRLIYLKSIRKSSVIISRISNSSDYSDRNLFYTAFSVQAIHSSYQPGRIAACQFEEVCTYSLLIVGISVEENICNIILFATLEYCL